MTSTTANLDISQVQEIKNKKRLVQQNKMLYEEVILFEKQLNQFLLTVSAQTNPETSIVQSEIEKIIQKQIEQQKKQIFQLRSQLNFLKSKNIKQNIEYILKEEDDLNILKRELYKFRKEKQIIMGFKNDKLKKLQGNNPLTAHQNELRSQLKQTIKFNRESYANMVYVQRQIRKYHEVVDIFRHNKDKQDSNSTSAQEEKLKLIGTQHQILNIKTQVKSIQQKWKNQLNTLDDQYKELRQLSQLKKKQLKQSNFNDNYFKSRMSVVRSSQVIESDRKRKEKVVASPKLKKQLQEYIKKESQKLKKKNQVHHLINDHEQNPNQQTVQNMQDDKNLKTINNYKNNRQKIDKNISVYQIQENRSQRTWNNNLNGGNSTLEESIKSIEKIQKQPIKKNKDDNVGRQTSKQSSKDKNKNIMPKLLLKNIGLGTSFHEN